MCGKSNFQDGGGKASAHITYLKRDCDILHYSLLLSILPILIKMVFMKLVLDLECVGVLFQIIRLPELSNTLVR